MADAKSKILIVEDDLDVAEMLNAYFRVQGYEVFTVNWGEDGVRAAQTVLPDLMILDIRLPDIDGFEVAQRVRSDRRTHEIPIIFLTEKRERLDRLKGFEVGADDYITKPFDSEVLLLKIKAILKRNEELNKEQENKEYNLSTYHFNPKLRQLVHEGVPQTLSPKENELLKLLCEYLNDLLPREQALKKIWGSDTYFNGRSMDVYIAKLRKYLKDDPKIEIVNIHGNGFRLVVK